MLTVLGTSSKKMTGSAQKADTAPAHRNKTHNETFIAHLSLKNANPSGKTPVSATGSEESSYPFSRQKRQDKPGMGIRLGASVGTSRLRRPLPRSSGRNPRAHVTHRARGCAANRGADGAGAPSLPIRPKHKKPPSQVAFDRL